mmetsp:Transcript_8798/g.25966  ORF Transcript_8798/g.25966 Transcript_8798/m.25966 type:complete len:209 (-) Transcript_8798:491-1117(-)
MAFESSWLWRELALLLDALPAGGSSSSRHTALMVSFTARGWTGSDLRSTIWSGTAPRAASRAATSFAQASQALLIARALRSASRASLLSASRCRMAFRASAACSTPAFSKVPMTRTALPASPEGFSSWRCPRPRSARTAASKLPGIMSSASKRSSRAGEAYSICFFVMREPFLLGAVWYVAPTPSASFLARSWNLGATLSASPRRYFS